MDENTNSVATPVRLSLLLLLLVIPLGAFLRIYGLGDKTVWLDEAFSIWIADHSLLELWQWLIKIDQHPPLYYTLLSFWQSFFGDLQGTVRLLSALFSITALPFFYGGARRLVDPWSALIATFILAIAPFHVNFAQEARMYSLLTLAVAVAFYFLTILLTSEPNESNQEASPNAVWIGFAVAQAAVMLTHNTALVYFTVTVNLVVGTLWLVARRMGPPSTLAAFNAANFGRRWIQFQALALLIWLPWAIPFVIQSIGVDRQFWLSPPTWDTVRNTQKTFNFLFLPGWVLYQDWLRSFYLLLAIFGIVRLRRSPARIFLLLALLFVPIGLALLISLRRPIYYDRTLIWASLSYYLLIGAGIQWIGQGIGSFFRSLILGRRPSDTESTPTSTTDAFNESTNGAKRGWSIVTYAVAPLLILSLMSWLNYHSLNGYYFWYQKEEWDKAAQYVAEQVGPSDLLLFNATWVQIPFEYYYRHEGKETELRGIPVDLFDRGELEPRMMGSDIPRLLELTQDRDRIWLVYSHDWYTDPTQIIPNTLGETMLKQDEQTFVGLKIMRFDAR